MFSMDIDLKVPIVSNANNPLLLFQILHQLLDSYFYNFLITPQARFLFQINQIIMVVKTKNQN